MMHSMERQLSLYLKWSPCSFSCFCVFSLYLIETKGFRHLPKYSKWDIHCHTFPLSLKPAWLSHIYLSLDICKRELSNLILPQCFQPHTHLWSFPVTWTQNSNHAWCWYFLCILYLIQWVYQHCKELELDRGLLEHLPSLTAIKWFLESCF